MLVATADVFLSKMDTAFINTPTVAIDASNVEGNTVGLSGGTYDGTKAAKVLITP